MSVKRTRNFATVVYPESAPENWLQILGEFFIPAFVSPLHDLDINPGGELKKAHYHVLIMFDSVKTVEQAKEIFKAIGGVGCEVVNSIRGYARYLCHLDNPDKVQYDRGFITAFCAADYEETIGLALDKYIAVREMIEFCNENNICSYAQLLTYAMTEHYSWFRVLCDSGTYVIKEYLKSKRFDT
ncbi:MAG: replication protein [Clostridia bacterium]